jgi:hypothetical protein
LNLRAHQPSSQSVNEAIPNVSNAASHHSYEMQTNKTTANGNRLNVKTFGTVHKRSGRGIMNYNVPGSPLAASRSSKF